MAAKKGKTSQELVKASDTGRVIITQRGDVSLLQIIDISQACRGYTPEFGINQTSTEHGLSNS